MAGSTPRLARARPQEARPPAVAPSCLPSAARAGRHRRGGDLARAGAAARAPTACLAAHYHKRLDQDERGIDVEGIAVRDGRAAARPAQPMPGRPGVPARGRARRTCSAHDSNRHAELRAICPGAWARCRDPRSGGGAGWRAGAERTVDRRATGAVRPLALGRRRQPRARWRDFAELGEAKAEGLLVLRRRTTELKVLVAVRRRGAGRPAPVSASRAVGANRMRAASPSR